MAPPKTSSIDYGVISDDKSLTDWELMERDRKIEAAQKQKEKERDKKKLDVEANVRAYRASHFFCNRSKTIIPKTHAAEIIEHRSVCPFCQETIEEKAKEMQFVQEGNCKMRYILHTIENAKEEIETQKRKIQREKKEKQPNWELMVKMAERKIQELENHIFSEGVEKHKLLRHENETVARSAKELYDAYLKMSESQRRRCQY
jgi:hypothetical protein